MLKTINISPKIDVNPRDLEKARSAIVWLASRCDFASTSDGKGFSGPDAVLGHALAEKEVWSPGETAAAFRLIVKYKKQLLSAQIDTTGLEAVRAALEKQLGAVRVRARDMVNGDVRVVDDTIVIKTSYHSGLLAEIKELVGRKWNPDLRHETCTLCAENAADIEDIAVRYGLKLHKHSQWDQLVPARRVDHTATEVLIYGVNARQVVLSLPEKTGKPAIDEKNFSAINILNPTCIAIPLKSWVIRRATLWLSGLDERDPNFARLHWAADDILTIMGDAYPKALQDERALYGLASATTLPQTSQEPIASTLPPGMVQRLMPHQWVAIHALLNKPQAILADQQGLGKTVEILAALESANAYPAVVCAPATAVLNWRDEVNRWLPHRRVCALGGKVGKREQGSSLENADIVVINYESFAKYADELAVRVPRSLVADEAQYLKGYDSARTKAIKEFCRSVGVQRIIAATGTPVVNRPSELLTLLTLLPDMLAELGGFQCFAARYCQATCHKSKWTSWWDYSGAANLGELANRIRETGRFVRRDKASVLPDLAAKRHEFEAVALCNQAEYTHAADDFSSWLKTQIKPYASPKKRQVVEDDDDLDSSSGIELFARFVGFTANEIAQFDLDRSEAIRRMTALRRLVGRGKIPAAVQRIKGIVKDEKLIVFAVHVEVQEALVAALTSDEGPPLSITGDMPAKARHEAIACFQENPKAKVIVCSLKAAQTAITLTAATRVLMVEMDWTPSTLEQAEDRAHRIGQTQQVTVTYLHAIDTLDDRMATIVKDKQAKIGILAATTAVHGFKRDGTPRKRPAGPGRSRLDHATRVARRKRSKAAWQEKNLAYMRSYMQTRRLNLKIKRAEEDIKVYNRIKDMTLVSMRYAMDDREMSFSEYKKTLESARKDAELATANLAKLQIKVKDIKQDE